MKIRRITATPINLNLEAPYVWVFGELDGFSPTIVEVETDDGLIGLGEAPSAAAAAIIAEVLAPRLIGRDAFDIACAESVCLPFWTGVQSINDRSRIMAFGAIEMALWDLRGKAWNQPLYQLLGGAVRKEIPFTDYFSLRGNGDNKVGEKTPEEVADYCVELHETCGTTFFEGKFSTEDPRISLRMLELIRKKLGDNVMLRIDSNQAYSLATARQLVRALEELNVRNWEDPVGTIEEMRELRRHCSIPFLRTISTLHEPSTCGCLMPSSAIRRFMAASDGWFVSSGHVSMPRLISGAIVATPASEAPPTFICARH